MADPGLLLRDLEEFRGTSRRPWIIIVVVVALLTLGAILLLKPTAKREDKGKNQSAATNSVPAQSATTTTEGSKPPTSDQIAAAVAPLLERARQEEAADDLPAARTNYLALLERDDLGAARPFVEERLGSVNILLVTTPRAMPEKVDYAIRSGDALKLLARRFGTTAELIEKANNIANPSLIHTGDRIRILDKPRFEVVVSKGRNELLLTLNGKFFKRYRVGTGEYGRTPAGTFKLENKMENPAWWRPDGKVIPFGDPENILGTRWMTLTATGETEPAKGYGIHGTWDNSSLGKQSSAGCIRMRNSEVEEIFLLVPDGTPVQISD